MGGRNIQKIDALIESYQESGIRNESTDLLKMLMSLKRLKKCPAIIFQENSTSCMRLVRQFAKQVEMAEAEKYPHLIDERMKAIKKSKKVAKEHEKMKVDDIPENKKHKMLMKADAPDLEMPDVVPIQEPHADFVFNEDQFFTGAVVEEWAKDLKKYFPNTGDDYHWLIIMLWRGVGVYVKGLPDPYLRLVQSLASAKKLAVVFSDRQLVFGVSMPFRTTVILRDVLIEDTLDSMMYHQMAGRAGRRGLDKEGNVIFANYSWDRINELSISSFPVVQGADTMVYSIDMAKKIATTKGSPINWDLMKSNFLHSGVTNSSATQFYSDISENFGEDGGWDFVSSDCINHNYMVWRLRHDMDCITVPLIIPEMKRIFEFCDPNREKDQVDLALFLSHFINLSESTSEEYVLPDSDYLLTGTASQLKTAADNLGIGIPDTIDSRVYNTILNN